MSKQSDPVLSLKEACVQAAHEVIAERGVESLSLREVARKLAISHQAPYRHFESRDHLLAEIMNRCFKDFAAHLEARPRTGGLEGDLESMGRAYLQYAQQKPLEYRLMFNTLWPEPAQHPDLVDQAVRAFNLLRDSLRAMHGNAPQHAALADQQAMFIWAGLHGLASITHSNVMPHLKLAHGVAAQLPEDLMRRMSQGLGPLSSPAAT